MNVHLALFDFLLLHFTVDHDLHLHTNFIYLHFLSSNFIRLYSNFLNFQLHSPSSDFMIHPLLRRRIKRFVVSYILTKLINPQGSFKMNFVKLSILSEVLSLTRKKNPFHKPMCQADVTGSQWFPQAWTIQMSVFIISLNLNNDEKWQLLLIKNESLPLYQSLQVLIVNGMSKAVCEESKIWQSKQAGKNESLHGQYCFLNTARALKGCQEFSSFVL